MSTTTPQPESNKMSTRETKRRQVGIPQKVMARIEALGDQMITAYEKGQGYENVPKTESSGGMSIPHWAVIERALDELEGHRARSNRKSA
jgi:hypothetical protein